MKWQTKNTKYLERKSKIKKNIHSFHDLDYSVVQTFFTISSVRYSAVLSFSPFHKIGYPPFNVTNTYLPSACVQTSPISWKQMK